MTDNNSSTPGKSIYRQAANFGLPLGIYLSIMAGCFFFSLDSAVASFMLLPLLIAFPFILAMRTIALARANPQYRKVAPLWVYGIYSTIFATLICSLFSALYMVLINPGFMHDYITRSVELLQASPLASEYTSEIELMKKMSESDRIPSPMQLVTSMGWAICFGGSMISLPIAWIASKITRNPGRNRQFSN